MDIEALVRPGTRWWPFQRWGKKTRATCGANDERRASMPAVICWAVEMAPDAPPETPGSVHTTHPGAPGAGISERKPSSLLETGIIDEIVGFRSGGLMAVIGVLKVGVERSRFRLRANHANP